MRNILPPITENTKIMILGFSREGKSSYRYIRKLFPDIKLYIHDIKQLDVSDLSNVECVMGDNYLDNLGEYDIILKSPGIVLSKEQVESCKYLTSQPELFIKAYRNQVIGISGTKGKSTTSSLTYHVLKKLHPNTFLVGNIGIPCFDCIEELDDNSWIVFELSCHQLEFSHVSPHIAVLLNFFEEHLDHYGTYENYKNAKKHIYEYQEQSDILICNQGILNELKPESKVITIGYDTISDIQVNEREITISKSDMCFQVESNSTHLLGLHNVYNVAVVFAILLQIYPSLKDKEFLNYIHDFEPLAHRLKWIGKYNNIDFYDDSISTACATAISALESIHNVDTILIGGMDRGIDYTELEQYLIHQYKNKVILMPNSGYRIYQELEAKISKEELARFYKVSDLKEAVELAKSITNAGKACVLSPAAASYGFFKDFEERGNYFIKYVNEEAS